MVRFSSEYACLWEFNTNKQQITFPDFKSIFHFLSQQDVLLYVNETPADRHTGPYQLWDVPDIKGDLDETPVAPDANVLTAIMIRIPQAD